MYKIGSFCFQKDHLLQAMNASRHRIWMGAFFYTLTVTLIYEGRLKRHHYSFRLMHVNSFFIQIILFAVNKKSIRICLKHYFIYKEKSYIYPRTTWVYIEFTLLKLSVVKWKRSAAALPDLLYFSYVMLFWWYSQKSTKSGGSKEHHLISEFQKEMSTKSVR